jgi:4-hydroxybenzoate polyprenyltransferase
VSAAGGGKLRAWLEVLRAPLLLSPVADVLAGWTVAAAFAATTDSLVFAGQPGDSRDFLRASLPRLGMAAVVGILFLASGMALNAVVDLREDRLRKPERPLPRGALRPATVALFAALASSGALLLVWCRLPSALLAAAALAGLIVAYHVGLKRLRLPGCLALGGIRALDFWFGVLALRAALADAPRAAVFSHSMPPGDWPQHVAVLFGLYMASASLHASTDDESGSRGWSRAGTFAACVMLSLQLLVQPAAPTAGMGAAADSLGIVVAGWAIVRVIRVVMGGSRPALTGALLSGLYLFHASACLATGWGELALMSGAAVLLLFGVSRLLLRSFPPT